MKITKDVIKSAFSKVEENLEFCWQVLIDTKGLAVVDKNFVTRFIIFQDKLASSIFDLQSIRDKIIVEEKEIVKNKVRYKKTWFLLKVRTLSSFKKGIDSAVNIAKALGDAYAHFFYQNDLELLSEHYTHQKVINHTASIGELGELEFLKRIKHIEGQFTLFHGITNTLRYGDFSFVDLKTLQVKQIGELKTKKIDENTLEFNISLIKRKPPVKAEKKLISDPELEKDRRGRQILGIANFLSGYIDPNSLDKNLINQSYVEQLNNLIKDTGPNSVSTSKVSPGLMYCCIRLKKTSLYNRIFSRDFSKTLNDGTKDLPNVVIKIIKPNSSRNGVIMGQLLYNPDFTDKNTPGTIPLFWHQIDNDILKQIYFTDCIVMPILNPAYLIDEIEAMGFQVETKYSDKKNSTYGPNLGIVQNFDLFISYIMNYLLTEQFVIDSISEIRKSEFWGKKSKISIRPQQRIDILSKKQIMKS